MKTSLLLGFALLAGASAEARDLHSTRVAVSMGYGDYIRRDRPFGYGGYHPGYRGGYGYSRYGSSFGIGYYGALPGYGDYGGTGRYAADGLWLGALTGAIIGHNSGDFRHDGWRGAAWGAGVGWLLGSIADANRRPTVYAQPTVLVSAPQPLPPVQPAMPVQAAAIGGPSTAPATPMSAANSLFGR